ncbi:site-specific integrase, partial [Dolichospermum sp. LEGE 00246]|nr:site-specific integrase [Dolichospermum sp. LEGE 00246]
MSETYPPSLHEDANADSRDWFADMFADFEPQNTTDGSYRGTMAKIKATELQYQAVFEQKLVEANTNLKRERIRVSIKQTGNSLQLRATLPLKPGDYSLGKTKKQYDLSLGIPANLEGLKTAIEECYELGKLIARHTFDWNEKYLGIKSREKQEIKTIGELLDTFDEKYYQTRQKTITSENT